MGRPNPSRETKFSGANGDRGIFFPVQLTKKRSLPYVVGPRSIELQMCELNKKRSLPYVVGPRSARPNSQARTGTGEYFFLFS